MNTQGKTDKKLQKMCVSHWKRMLKLTVAQIRWCDEVPNVSNCAFCDRYAWEYFCVGCPVYEETGDTNCDGSPYQAAADLYFGIQGEDHAKIKTFRKAAQKEIEFLEGLTC